MNYRHAFHAGNFGDCMKHALLVWLLRAMARKPAGFFVLDTHAGAGQYDLAADAAERTGESAQGIKLLLDSPPPALADYIDVVKQCGLYPGSPAIAAAVLRPQDRLACCELHPEDYALLRRLFRGQPDVAVHHRDAWEAVNALLPPKEKRGLILIDPPFEVTDEFAKLTKGLVDGHAKFPSGVFAAWYPIKHRAPVRAFHTTLSESGIKDIVVAEFWIRAPLDAGKLNGCGVAVINPPYRFTEEIPPILDALTSRLAADLDAGATVERLADE